MKTNHVLVQSVLALVSGAALVSLPVAPTIAHEATVAPTASAGTTNPATLVELASVQRATARFLDVQAAIDEGYADAGVFYANMGHHYVKAELLDDKFELTKPEFLVYADDPCGGPRRLVAVEYAVPLALADRAPAGFAGSDDTWTINQQYQLWTLHAWAFEYNPAGVFAAHNVRVP